MPHKWTTPYFNQRPPVVLEHEQESAKAAVQPKNLRHDMLTLQTHPWQTTAVQSEGSIMQWIFDKEDELRKLRSQNNTAEPSVDSGEPNATVGFPTDLLIRFTHKGSHCVLLDRKRDGRTTCISPKCRAGELSRSTAWPHEGRPLLRFNIIEDLTARIENCP